MVTRGYGEEHEDVNRPWWHSAYANIVGYCLGALSTRVAHLARSIAGMSPCTYAYPPGTNLRQLCSRVGATNLTLASDTVLGIQELAPSGLV